MDDFQKLIAEKEQLKNQIINIIDWRERMSLYKQIQRTYQQGKKQE